MDKVKGQRVLVTGGAGFIGIHLVDWALAQGAKRVVALDSLVAGRLEFLSHLDGEARLEFVRGDVRDAALVTRLVQDSDIVFHEAASKLVVSRNSPRTDMETNVGGTLNVLEAARGRDVRIVHASTGSVLGSSDRPMREDHAGKPTTLYGISKAAAENYCLFYHREFGVRVSVLRYFHVFGPRQAFDGEAGVVSIFLGCVLQGQPPVVYGTGEQIRCFTFVGDDVRANALLLERDETIGQVYNVASRNRVSITQLAETIIERYGPPGMKPVYGAPRPGENLRPVPDTTKIEALGFAGATPFDEGLELTRQWVAEQLGAEAATHA